MQLSTCSTDKDFFFFCLFSPHVAFGIGSMIYSGLEFGQYFELERDTKCHNVLVALTPATRMAFIFIQMYFIFLNNEVSRKMMIFLLIKLWLIKFIHAPKSFSLRGRDEVFKGISHLFFFFSFFVQQQIKVYRYKILARFGLMHMIGTNLSVWFSVLIQETKHEILTFYEPENLTLRISHRLGK